MPKKGKQRETTENSRRSFQRSIAANDNDKHEKPSVEEESSTQQSPSKSLPEDAPHEDASDSDSDELTITTPDKKGEHTQDEILNAESTDEPPPAKFKPMDKVIARDRDGVMYEAVVRRALYGLGQPESIPFGFCSLEETKILEEQAANEPPCWHYFIHYNQWRANWDRWVREYDVYEVNEATKEYASRVATAHKELRQSMTRKIKGKKTFQTIDGAKFLQEWRKRLNRIDAQLKIHNPRFDVAAALRGGQPLDFKDKRASLATASPLPLKKAALLEEQKLRERGLTKKKRDADTNVIVLPLGLKKALVDQWEIITQCGMVTDLPAKITVRDTLNEYVRSKGVDPSLYKRAGLKGVVKVSPTETEQVGASTAKPTGKVESESIRDNPAPEQPNSTEEHAGHAAPSQHASSFEDVSISQESATPMDVDSPDKKPAVGHSKDDTEKNGESVRPQNEDNVNRNLDATEETQNQDKEDESANEEVSEEVKKWIDMADGIAQFFDEALPDRLLYREEYAQLRAIQGKEGLAEKPYSEIYGCEYLLRLLTRLPGVLMRELSPDECHPIFAKLNDLVRFLHKNQSNVLTAHHRKPDGDERTEALRMELRQQKKRHRNTRESPSQKLAAKKAKMVPESATVDVDKGELDSQVTHTSEQVESVVEKTATGLSSIT